MMINAVNEFLDDLRGGRMSEAPVVKVEQGELQGRVASTPSGKSYYSFQGIPYAKPPLGSLRFKAPQPAEPWEGIRDATSEGNVSAQIDLLISKQYQGDENCLFLNIYTPTLDGAFLPVMVYFHGGLLLFGSGNTDMYGPDYLVEKDVVVVTLNYRLGALGFLCLNTPDVPGNAGIKDMVLALQWVKENIHNFGGNARNLTIFGESAGGLATSVLSVSPLSKHMISKVAIQSGNGLCSWGLQKTPIENARSLAKVLGCDAENVDDILEFLTTTPARDIVEAHAKLYPLTDSTATNGFMVAIEKEFPGVEAVITESFLDLLTSGRVAQVPVLIGTTSLEIFTDKKPENLQKFIPEELNIEKGSAEALEIEKQIQNLYFKEHVDENIAYSQLLSDSSLNFGTHRYVQNLIHSANIPVFYYKFDYVGELNIGHKLMHVFDFAGPGYKHAVHLDELAYLFRTALHNDVEPTPQDLKTRERMVRLWTNFAKTGNPTPEENHYINVTWQPATKDDLQYLNIGEQLVLKSNPDKERMDFWDELYNKHFKIWDQKVNNEEVPRKLDTIISEITSNAVSEFSSQSVVTSVTYTESSVTDGETVVTETLVIVNDSVPEPEVPAEESVVVTEKPVDVIEKPVVVTEEPVAVTAEPAVETRVKVEEPVVEPPRVEEPKNLSNGVGKKEKARTSNEIKMVQSSNGASKDVIRANDPPEDDLPKNIGVNKFVNFFESLGGKKK